MLTDSELLRRYVSQHDELAFTELVQRHIEIVFNAALRRVNGNRDLAEEAAQIVFTQLACKANRLAWHCALLGWLHTSTRFAASVLIRRERRVVARQQLAATMSFENADTLDWESLRPLIDEALDHLSAQHRQAVLLRYFASRSYAEIGTELHLSENASRKCVERALESLRRQFVRLGVTTTSSVLATALTAAPSQAAPAPLAASIAASATANATMAAGVAVPAFIVAFMSTAKLSSLTVAAAALVGLATLGTVVTWSQHQQRQQTQLDALHAETNAIRSHQRTLQSEAAVSPRSTGANPGNASSLRSGMPEVLRREYQASLAIATSPAFATIREQQDRLKFLHEYGAFVTARNYPSEKIEALRRAVTEYYQASTRHLNEMMLGESTTSAGAAKEFAAITEADRQALFEKIGPAFSQEEQQDIRRCFESQEWMGRAREIGYALAFADLPADRVQKLALAMISADAANAAKTASPEMRRQLQAVDPTRGLSLEDQKLLQDAAVFLSPAQLQIYETYLRLEQVRADATRQAREILKKRSSSS